MTMIINNFVAGCHVSTHLGMLSYMTIQRESKSMYTRNDASSSVAEFVAITDTSVVVLSVVTAIVVGELVGESVVESFVV